MIDSHPKKLPVIGFFVLGVASSAGASTLLTQTKLYGEITSNCRNVELRDWSHPTGQVLKKAGVTVDKVELCNEQKYPIFTVKFRYDPQGATSAYFDPLYAQMAAANGFWPYSFVDESDNLVINVGISSRHEISLKYERYVPSPISSVEAPSR